MSILSELKSLPPSLIQPLPEGKLDVSLIIPARNASHSLVHTVEQAYEFLNSRFQGSFEIILVPNPAPGDTQDPTQGIAEALSKKYSGVRVCPHSLPPGKGAAIRTGFWATQGKWIFLTDSDLPYDLRFFDGAVQKLKSGYDLVNGNRRLPSSKFNIPVRLLPLVYGRHRLGIGFNRLVRFLLPIRTTDTQAGIKALSRRLALEVFRTQECPGFLYDLEIFLTAARLHYAQVDLPITLHLNTEKSTVRILRECLLVSFWLSKLWWRQRMNVQPKLDKKRIQIGRRFKQAPWLTRLFLSLRWGLTPYSKMAEFLPRSGTILDLGCGHGLFAMTAALGSSERNLIGIDHDEDRISLANHAIRDIPNVKISRGNMTQPPGDQKYAGIAIIDAMHYFNPSHQESLLQQSYDLLENGGVLLVREVNPHGGLASVWNRFYEKVATGIGFTQAEKENLHFRSPPEWESLMKKVGFQVNSQPCSSVLFADILYVCERTH